MGEVGGPILGEWSAGLYTDSSELNGNELPYGRQTWSDHTGIFLRERSQSERLHVASGKGKAEDSKSKKINGLARACKKSGLSDESKATV